MYSHSEYRREHEDRDNKQGGWRSWFGLDNKDRDEDYKYSNTTTYRTNPTYGPEPRPYGSSPYTSSTRGGYGYTTTEDYTRPTPSWNTDRDYNTRSGYGTTGDRDVYYKSDTRTYGGDNWTPRRSDNWTRPTGESCDWKTTRDCPVPPTSRPFDSTYSRPYGPTGEYRSSEYTRPYGFSGERDVTTSRYETPSRYETSRYETPSRYETSSRYPVTGERDFYPTTSRWNTEREYPTSRSYGYESRGYPTTYNTPSTYRF